MGMSNVGNRNAFRWILGYILLLTVNPVLQAVISVKFRDFFGATKEPRRVCLTRCKPSKNICTRTLLMLQVLIDRLKAFRSWSEHSDILRNEWFYHQQGCNQRSPTSNGTKSRSAGFDSLWLARLVFPQNSNKTNKQHHNNQKHGPQCKTHCDHTVTMFSQCVKGFFFFFFFPMSVWESHTE